jgi:hypothetical protein
MQFSTLRSVASFGIAALLAACGGPQPDQSSQTAASVQTGVATTSAAVDGTSASIGNGVGNGAGNGAGSGVPLPDCAADGCNSPRIIDANAEAYRYAAMQRAAAGDPPQS